MQVKNVSNRIFYIAFFLVLVFFVFVLSCNKLVQVPNPINSVTANQVFSSDATATAAILGIYSNMSLSNGNKSFSNSMTTLYLAVSADELSDEDSGFEIYDHYLVNHLNALQDGTVSLNIFWAPAYYDIYSANAVIAGLQGSTVVSEGTRDELIGEAKFIRAFCYFYLTNIFGAVPIDLTPDFNKTVLLAKSPQTQVYRQIVSDLIDAQNSLPNDFSLTNGMPIRANKWAATALLARVYLYLSSPNWRGADSAASAVINSGQFKLIGLDSVFLANSKEAILQLQPSPNAPPYATVEGNIFNPVSSWGSPAQPSYWLTSQLLNSFEANDQRRYDWVDSNDAAGYYLYYPYKYKVQFGNIGQSSPENYTLLRLAEQYLIRAEAEANLNQLGNAINDINTIRNRAGLDSLPSSLNQPQVISALQQECRIEFFAEWGHRWLDLRRWDTALSTLGAISYKAPYLDSSQLLYPIPITEIQTDPNLTQNFGY